MTFESIAFKNFRHQLRKYLTYFLCSSFSIMIFFMYAVLIYNEELSEEAREGFQLVLSTGMYSISVFAVLFISYAHSAFIKSRHKEFAVYMTLGMSSGHIRRLVLFENLLIIALSFCLGMGAGAVFSRLFQMIAARLLDIEGIGFSIGYEPIVLTISVFSAIFGIIIAMNWLSLRKLDISQLFARARRVENERGGHSSTVLGLVGLACILLACAQLVYAGTHRESAGFENAQLLFFFMAFGGMYLVISNIGNGLLAFIKRKPELYYNNLLVATQMNYQFHQNKKILLVLSILSTMLILFVGMTFSMYTQSERMSASLQPNHLEYAELGELNRLPTADIRRIVGEEMRGAEGANEDDRAKRAKAVLKSASVVEFLDMTIANNTDDGDTMGSKPFVSVTSYKEATGVDLHVGKGEAVSVVIRGSQVMSNYKPQTGTMELKLPNRVYRLTVNRVIREEWVSGLSLYPSLTGMVISDRDYGILRGEVEREHIGIYRSFMFDEWEKTKGIVTTLRSALEGVNQTAGAVDEENRAKLFNVASRIEFYEEFQQGYSMAIFVLSIIGALFFIASINVLYFKQFSEISVAKEKYRKLFKVGITTKEIVRALSIEMRVVFFIPLVLAVVPGLSNIWFANSMLDGRDVMGSLMLSSVAIIAVYFILQAVLYMVVRRLYCSEVLSGI